MTIYNEIMEELKQEIEQGIDLDDIRDRSYEYVDNYVPVYNNRVIEEWQNMDSEYDNRGAAELGYDVEHLDIIKLMQADLYLYYQDLVSLVLDDLAEEIEEASSDES
jgi:hypothetical protein